MPSYLQVQLVGPVGPKLMQLLPSSVQVPQYSHGTDDEVHLIMEYSVGEKWGETSTPVATRFITSSDKANGDMMSLEPFFSGLSSFNADLVVLSGLHLLDGNPIWREKMEMIGRSLQQVPHGQPLHLELASMADPEIMSNIIHEVGYGQELSYLQQCDELITTIIYLVRVKKTCSLYG